LVALELGISLEVMKVTEKKKKKKKEAANSRRVRALGHLL
jgi:hypothetical protein